jgi:carboxylesterase type B
MWSNGSGVQPKRLEEHQLAFNELLSRLNIPGDQAATEKLRLLRALPADDIVKAIQVMEYSEFRGLTVEDGFIDNALISHINSGEFGRRMKPRGVRLMNGECRDEHNLYRAWRTPADSYEALSLRLRADYPAASVLKVLDLYCPERSPPAGCRDWIDLFGRIYADLQVHCLERGLAYRLCGAGGLIAGQDLLRYRIEWRARCADAMWPVDWLVTHDTDEAIWWWGNAWPPGLTEQEKGAAREMNTTFADFVAGKDIRWPVVGDPTYMRRLNSDGETDGWYDDRWEEALRVWNAVNGDEA